MLETIAVIRELSSCPTLPQAPRIASGATLEITQFDEGGFGTLYRCARIAGAASPPLVVKLLRSGGNGGAIVALHSAIAKGRIFLPTGFESHLRGLPFWVGEVRYQGAVVTALVGLDLAALGFVQFDQVLDEQWKRYRGLELAKRVQLAHSFAAGYAILEALHFLHADVNSDNLFVNMDTAEALLIDYDSGVLRVTGIEIPQTRGRPNEFIAPELKSAAGVDITKFDEAAERWAVGLLIHTLIFGIHPLFFLSELSHSAIVAFRKRHDWPEFDFRSALSTLRHSRHRQKDAYFYWHYNIHDLGALEQLRPEATRLFKVFINEGALTPDKRPSASAWVKALVDPTLIRATPTQPSRCSFCGTHFPEGSPKLVKATQAAICDQCVSRCDVLLHEARGRPVPNSDFFALASDWEEGTLFGNTARVYRRSGFYHLAILSPPAKSAPFWHSCAPDITLSDFRVSVEAGLTPDFLTRTKRDAFYGVVFRKNGQTGYFFSVSRRGNFALHCFATGRQTKIVNGVFSDHINQEAVLNTLIAEMRGAEITLGVNGHTLLRLTDTRSGLATGSVGIHVGSFSADTLTEARFRHFRLYDLS